MSERFDDAVPVLTALSIFDQSLLPSKSKFRKHGVKEMKVLAAHYFQGEKEEQLIAEWQAFVYELASWEIPSDTISPAEYAILRLNKQAAQYKHCFPLLAEMAQKIIVIPVSNAWPERGISKVKLIKTRLRNRLNEPIMNALLHISINGPPMSESKPLIEKCVDAWNSSKKRRKVCKLPATSVNEQPSDEEQALLDVAVKCLDIADDGTDESESESDDDEDGEEYFL